MSILDESREVIGDDELIKRAVEEMAELIVAISHFARYKGDIEEVREEIADVMIAMRQLEVIYGEFETERIREIKIRKFKQEIEVRKSLKVE